MSSRNNQSKKSEIVQSEAANRLQAIIETAIDGIITINNRGIIETVNPAAARLFGYQREEMIGKNVTLIMPQSYQDQHDAYIHNYEQTGHAKIIGIGREVEGKKKNGGLFPIRLAVGKTIVADKTIYTGIIHDLSEIKKAENQIRKLNQDLEDKVEERTETLAQVVNQLLRTNKKLEKEITERTNAEEELLKTQKELRTSLEKEKELNELKSRFVSMASHEFRTPLSTILSSVSLIMRYEKEEHQEKRVKHIRRIKAAVKNLNGILDDFLSLSKLEEGMLIPSHQEFNIYNFCHETREHMEGLLKKGQHIESDFQVDDPIVHLDKQFLNNILFNLLSNAIKYSGDNKPIFFKVVLDDNNLTISVKDFGIGIPEEDHSYLFTRFFRANNAINIQGTGLGLNIVRKYVELLNGEIYFESQLGKGSEFTVKLPARQN